MILFGGGEFKADYLSRDFRSGDVTVSPLPPFFFLYKKYRESFLLSVLSIKMNTLIIF